MTGAPHPPSTLEAVVQRFSRMVLSIGRRAGLDEADLDELIQAVRVRLWRARGAEWRDGDVNATYVHQAARSAAIDIVRTRRGQLAQATEPLRDDGVLPDRATLPADRVVQQETTDRIMAVLETLAPDRRTAVSLHLAGYSREEISAMLGWQGARTRNLIHRGMEDLRARLTALGFTPHGES